MERYDIAIIGSGPAGISAAITAKIRNKNIVIFGQADLSEKLTKAQRILNYPGLPDISGADLAKAFEKHLSSLDIGITQKKVSAVYALGKYFALEAQGETYEASSVILATGVSNISEIDGESRFLGRGVSYCATCDAPLYRGKEVIVIGYTKEAWSEAEFLAQTAKKVCYVPMCGYAKNYVPNIEIVNAKPLEIAGDTKASALRTDNGEIEADGIFIMRDSVSPQNLVPGLKTEYNHIKTDADMRTNIAGLFACGDAVGKPYQYVKAAGQGNVAALSAVDYLTGI